MKKQTTGTADPIHGRRDKVVSRRIDDHLESFVLSNVNGMKVTLLNYGAAIAGIKVPDREGKLAEVTLGHPDLRDYIGGRFFLGATVGRYANRIARGRFVLDGTECQVTTNSKGNHLHGGVVGFDKKYWKPNVLRNIDDPWFEFTLVSPGGDEGFPGELEVKVVYALTDENDLQIRYTAVAEEPTVLNLTNHSYFNLTGSPGNSILDHILMINAEKFTATDGMSIPTGEIEGVSGTPLDFREATRIGDRIDSDFLQLKYAGGYDQNFVLEGYDGTVRRVASVYEPNTGRMMEVFTDQPGMQFYSGNYLDGTLIAKDGSHCERRSGLCLECQHFPDSPNHEEFPSVVLRPDEVYRQTTIYKFSAK